MQCKSERGFLFVPSATLTERISASLQCKRERETQLKVPSASASALREAFFLKVKRQRNAAKGAPLRGVRHSLQGRSVSGTKAAMHPFASLRRVLGNDSFSISGRVSLKEERQTLSQRKRRNPSRERGLCLFPQEPFGRSVWRERPSKETLLCNYARRGFKKRSSREGLSVLSWREKSLKVPSRSQ